MLEANKPILTALFSADTVESFLTMCWPRQPFLVQGDIARLPAVLRAQELTSIQALARCYRGNLRFTHGRQSDQMIQIDRVDATVLAEMGLTLQFQDIVPYIPGAKEFLLGLEIELGLNENSLTMSAFYSPQQDGLSCHYDAQDLISIQLIGSKRFHHAPMREITNPYGTQYVSGTLPYDDELYPQASNGFPDSRNIAFETAEMRPGTVLYLPRGTWHYTEASEPSLAISIAISPPAMVDCVLEQLRWLLLQDSGWREPLYGATANGPALDKLQIHAANLLARLPHLISCLSPMDLIQAPLPVIKRLDKITMNTRFQKIPDATLEVDPVQTQQTTRTVSIRTGHAERNMKVTARIEISSEILAVLRWIEARPQPFACAELQLVFPVIALHELKAILATLTRAKFIKMFWYAALTPDVRVNAPYET